MTWLYLLLAIAAFAIALKAPWVWLAVVCLLAALALLLASVMSLLARRVGSQSRDENLILDPQELRRLREQAEARRAAMAGSEPPAA